MSIPGTTSDDRTPDVHVHDEGSIVLFELISESAKVWVSEKVSDDAQWFGHRLVVEPRYVEDLVNGMKEDGLEVSV